MLVQSSSVDFRYGFHVEFIASVDRTERKSGG
jgi:hypothetical protein